MLINTNHRRNDAEIMDDFALSGRELGDALDKIALINRILGGNRLTLQGVRKLVKYRKADKTIKILDIGCGNGDMLRALADEAGKMNRKLQLKGVDANAYTIEHARRLSENYPAISYECRDIFSETYVQEPVDIILCTLTLHHFSEEQIVRLLTMFRQQSKLGIVINDLQRSAVAYYLFKVVAVLMRLNKMATEDGLLSILRGFKRKELADFAEKLNFKKYSIRRRWAFRFQWIIWIS